MISGLRKHRKAELIFALSNYDMLVTTRWETVFWEHLQLGKRLLLINVSLRSTELSTAYRRHLSYTRVQRLSYSPLVRLARSQWPPSTY